MENIKSFLETWKEVIEKLRDEGMITQEDIENGVELPFEWLYSSGIQRDAVILALRNLYESKHPDNRYTLTRFKKLASLWYCEKEGKPALEAVAGKASVFITDEEMQSKGWSQNITTEEFINNIISAKKRLKMIELMEKGKLSKEDAMTTVNLFFDERQIKSDLYAMPHNIDEMARNFGEYYKYIQEESQYASKEDGPIEIEGGIIEPVTDIVPPRDRPINPTRPRVSEIYPFQQRDEIFRKLKPERIIKFKGIDRESGEVIDGALTCYVYNRPQGNDGYVVIAEPLEGDKETQAFYLSTEFVESLMPKDEDMKDFWRDLTREYVERMTRTQFAKEDSTWTLRHTTDLDAYREKIEGIILGMDNNSQKPTVRRASRRLFGKEKYKDGIGDCRRRGISEARQFLQGRESEKETKEGEDVTND